MTVSCHGKFAYMQIVAASAYILSGAGFSVSASLEPMKYLAFDWLCLYLTGFGAGANEMLSVF